MKSMQNFERLAVAARGESAPAPDVAAAVMSRVRREAQYGASVPAGFLVEDGGGLPLWSVAAALLVVGFTTALVGYGMWSDWNGSVYASLTDFSSWGLL